jgi:hypothetical protein
MPPGWRLRSGDRHSAGADLPRDSTGVGALKHKTEIATNGQHGSEVRGHSHLGGVLVDFSH